LLAVLPIAGKQNDATHQGVGQSAFIAAVQGGAGHIDDQGRVFSHIEVFL
jgi:hypothetical protein